MKRFVDALYGPHHATMFAALGWIGTVVLVADAFGVLEPDYLILAFAVAFSYWIGVAIEPGLFGGGEKR
ncbi:hypothetical protein SH584_11635 [Sphingomonas sp. LY29]|uniref:hypothetical protein n=1 Tax=Sphingomonas sp. LY29 TaxID=3095341 RepID=UPI002D7656F4|nr:hypothetical protein [Sphingomonas sp. LY29]WRP25682.1 hypothetical protein SH584_11635 [Sphingomonas sp. LY29]